MGSSRVLSTFELHSGNSGLRVTYAGVSATITLSTAASTAPEIFCWSLDNETGPTPVDFGKRLEDKLEAQFGAGTWTAQINGVDVTDTTRWEGHVKYGCGASTCSFDLAHSGTTLDPRILGFASSGEDGDVSPAAGSGSTKTFSSQVLWSDYVHRYGWYPHTDPDEDLPTIATDVEASYTSAGYVDVQDWGEYEEGSYTWREIASYFVRSAAAEDTVRVSGTGGTAGDQCCAFERFVADLSRSSEQLEARAFYVYATITENDPSRPDRMGPYRFPPESPIWLSPLSTSQLTNPAGERWTIMLPIRTATGFGA